MWDIGLLILRKSLAVGDPTRNSLGFVIAVQGPMALRSQNSIKTLTLPFRYRLAVITLAGMRSKL